MRKAACEVFTYGLRVDFLEISFYVYHLYRTQIVESGRVVEPLVQSLKDSANYAKEKSSFS